MFTVEQFFEVLLTTGEPTAEGLRLPTERNLAESTGLSRATVREHLSALRVMGLLTKTQGSANVLHAPNEESSAAIYRVLLQMRHATLADVAIRSFDRRRAESRARPGRGSHGRPAALRTRCTRRQRACRDRT